MMLGPLHSVIAVSSPIRLLHASVRTRRLRRGNRLPMLATMAGARKYFATVTGNRQIPPIAGTLASVLLVAGMSPPHAIALQPAAELASHRAVYELKLAHSRGNSSAVSARGRILYDFSGNSCDGYVLQFRQVSELDNGAGEVTISGLR